MRAGARLDCELSELWLVYRIARRADMYAACSSRSFCSCPPAYLRDDHSVRARDIKYEYCTGLLLSYIQNVVGILRHSSCTRDVHRLRRKAQVSTRSCLACLCPLERAAATAKHRKDPPHHQSDDIAQPSIHHLTSLFSQMGIVTQQNEVQNRHRFLRVKKIRESASCSCFSLAAKIGHVIEAEV